MIIGKDKKGLLHVVVGPEELKENLPAKIAEAMSGCHYDVDERADLVNEILLEELARYDRRGESVL